MAGWRGATRNAARAGRLTDERAAHVDHPRRVRPRHRRPRTSTSDCSSASNAGIDTAWRDEARRRQELMGPVGMRASGHPHIFPNLWITGRDQVSLRMPKGPTRPRSGGSPSSTTNCAGRARSDGVQPQLRHNFGPAGMLEQEDGENWDQSTRGTSGTVSKRYPLNYAMNLGHGEIIEDEGGPPYIDDARQRARPALALPRLGGLDGGRELGRAQGRALGRAARPGVTEAGDPLLSC